MLRGDGYHQSQSFVAPTAAGSDPSQSYYTTVTTAGYVFDWNHNINDHLINDLHAGFHYFQFQNLPFFAVNSIVVTLPAVTAGEPYNQPEIFNQYTQQYRDDVFWMKGKHNFKFGGEYLYTLHGGAFPQYLRGGLTTCTPAAGSAAPNYAAMFPQGTLSPSTWNYAAINSYCNSAELFTQAFGQYNISIGRNIIGVWAQDDWKILPRLTLNLGLRYDNDLGAYNTSYVPTAGLLTPNTNPNANFAPRLGFAYDPFGDGKTSIRGGAGLYFADQVANAIIDEQLYSSTARALQATVSGTNLALPSPFAGQTPTANPQNYVTSPQPVLRGAKTPYSLQASFGVQRELGFKTTLTADFVHTRVYGDFIALSGNLLENPTNAQQNLNPATAMTSTIYGERVCGNGGILLDTLNTAALSTAAPGGTSPSGAPIGAPAKQVCNQLFGGAVRQFTTYPGAGVIADALQVGVKHAITGGFTGAIAYTWGRVKNSTNGAFGYPNKPFAPGIQQEWANGTDDQRHTLTVTGEYKWKYGLSLSSLYHFGSGLAFATSSGTTINGYANSTRTFSGQPISAGQTCAPVAPLTTCSTIYAPLSKTYFDSAYGYYIIQRDGFRGSDYNRVDSRLQESFRIKERYRATVGIEAFNLFNHTNFGNFATTASQGPLLASGAANANAYGHPASVPNSTSLEYYARNLQFIGRFSF
jgi:TonB dependent receptor